jgi:hypothetical protein
MEVGIYHKSLIVRHSNHEAFRAAVLQADPNAKIEGYVTTGGNPSKNALKVTSEKIDRKTIWIIRDAVRAAADRIRNPRVCYFEALGIVLNPNTDFLSNAAFREVMGFLADEINVQGEGALYSKPQVERVMTNARNMYP